VSNGGREIQKTWRSWRSWRLGGWLVDGEFGLGTGLEGGNRGGDGIEWARARTRVVAGMDLRVDESESEGTGIRAFVEIEKQGSVGGEFRYVRWITRSVGFYGGVVGTVTPETLFGGGVGGRFLIPFAPRAGVFIEPSFNVLPLGSETGWAVAKAVRDHQSASPERREPRCTD